MSAQGAVRGTVHPAWALPLQATFTAQCPFLQHVCDLVTVCPEVPACPLWVIQPRCHLYFSTMTRILLFGQTRLCHAPLPQPACHLLPQCPRPRRPLPPQCRFPQTTAAPPPASYTGFLCLHPVGPQDSGRPPGSGNGTLALYSSQRSLRDSTSFKPHTDVGRRLSQPRSSDAKTDAPRGKPSHVAASSGTWGWGSRPPSQGYLGTETDAHSRRSPEAMKGSNSVPPVRLQGGPGKS